METRWDLGLNLQPLLLMTLLVQLEALPNRIHLGAFGRLFGRDPLLFCHEHIVPCFGCRRNESHDVSRTSQVAGGVVPTRETDEPRELPIRPQVLGWTAGIVGQRHGQGLKLSDGLLGAASQVVVGQDLVDVELLAEQ